MPTAAEIRERGEQIAGRLQVFTNQSMQQVRTLASRGASYVQHKFIAFNASCRRKDDAQNWSTDSERNSQQRDSSKNSSETQCGKRMWAKT